MEEIFARSEAVILLLSRPGRGFFLNTQIRLYKHVRNQLGGEVPYLGLLVEREEGGPDT